jgi:hypothetical protein
MWAALRGRCPEGVWIGGRPAPAAAGPPAAFPVQGELGSTRAGEERHRRFPSGSALPEEGHARRRTRTGSPATAVRARARSANPQGQPSTGGPSWSLTSRESRAPAPSAPAARPSQLRAEAEIHARQTNEVSRGRVTIRVEGKWLLRRQRQGEKQQRPIHSSGHRGPGGTMFCSSIAGAADPNMFPGEGDARKAARAGTRPMRGGGGNQEGRVGAA